MNVSSIEVKHIAKLSKLQFTEQQYPYLAEQLNDILHLVEQLKTVNCEGVEPLTSVHSFNLLLREDIEGEIATPAELFQNVPGSEANLAKEIHYYIVPKVLE